MDQNSRLLLATRIHFALLRHFNEDVDVRSLLKDGSAAEEALWVCEASGHPELVALADQFRLASRDEARAQKAALPPASAAPQDAPWSHDTSGFGLSHPPDDGGDAHGSPTITSAWPSPMSWLRRSVTRSAR
ncbi:MAG: hypothetical protein JSR59_02325 [Proteobacteria bacterium]|nr:hypothetical protein [Pseudomonadota bacterium]